MKKLVLGLLILCAALSAFRVTAQDQETKASKKQERLDRKEERAAAFEAEKEQVLQMAQDRDIVLEAITISGKFGYNQTNVGPNNFIMIDSAQFVIQTSSPSFVGQNGIGGLTVRGTVASYTVSQGKNATNVIAQVNTFGLGSATLTFTLVGKQNCRVTFSTASGIVLNMAGPVARVSESKIFRGMNLN